MHNYYQSDDMQSIEISISEMYSKHWKAKRATLTFQTEIHKHSNK